MAAASHESLKALDHVEDEQKNLDIDTKENAEDAGGLDAAELEGTLIFQSKERKNFEIEKKPAMMSNFVKSMWESGMHVHVYTGM